jgi:hypothetical protein
MRPENFADPLPAANLLFAADPEARATAEELIRAVGLEPAYLGDASATATVDALLPPPRDRGVMGYECDCGSPRSRPVGRMAPGP